MPYDPVIERIKKLEKGNPKSKELTILDKIQIFGYLDRVKFGFDKEGSAKRQINQWKKVLGKTMWNEILKADQQQPSPKVMMKNLSLFSY